MTTTICNLHRSSSLLALTMTMTMTALALVGCGGSDAPVVSNAPVITGPASDKEAAPTQVACPTKDSTGATLNVNVPANTTCYTGINSKGSGYIIAVPPNWNGRLLLHAHGGPDLTVNPDRAAEVLDRWDIMVRAGYALAGSAFRTGVEVSRAAEDTERLRGIFRAHIGRPSMTILHGQSWGGSVAAKAAETYTRDTIGEQPYDAVLLSAGVLAGGTRSYDFRMDLRAIYQHLCNNHPRPTEPQYQLSIGFPAGVTPPTNADLTTRVNECLALNTAAASRTQEQRDKLATILNVVKIAENQIVSHLAWGTRHFQDISQRHGGSPFGNTGAVYTGSTNDAALNAAVPRFRADLAAFRTFAADTDYAGRIPVPVLTVKWISDPTAFVELDAHFRTLMQQSGTSDRLVQTFVSSAESHSYISDATYVALLSSLTQWVQNGQKPTPQDVASTCTSVQTTFNAGVGCAFNTSYTPPTLASRVPVRERP
jgi:hypothetical protein